MEQLRANLRDHAGLVGANALGPEIFRPAEAGTGLPQTNLSIDRRETNNR